jgi:hypothetical protein
MLRLGEIGHGPQPDPRVGMLPLRLEEILEEGHVET